MSRVKKFLKRALGKDQTSRYLAPRFPNYPIGPASYGKLELHSFGDGTQLRIGNYCSFAEGVKIMLGGNHRADWVTTYPFNVFDPRFAHIEGHPASKGDVIIGNDVWLARDVLILSGVTIGDGCIVGAGAVVSRDMPPYSIAVGNPAQVIKSRFAPEIVARLLEIAWWDWPEERVAKAVPYLLSTRIEAFIDAVDNGDL